MVTLSLEIVEWLFDFSYLFMIIICHNLITCTLQDVHEIIKNEDFNYSNIFSEISYEMSEVVTW
jgi:hypothetical protein